MPLAMCPPSFLRERLHFCRREPPPLTGLSSGDKHQTADGRPVQGLHPIPHGRHHALDLVVLAFRQCQSQVKLADRFTGLGLHRLGIVVQHHALPADG